MIEVIQVGFLPNCVSLWVQEVELFAYWPFSYVIYKCATVSMTQLMVFCENIFQDNLRITGNIGTNKLLIIFKGNLKIWS